jgi:N-acetyl-anhydromuramyl-L-alanine amidase AmpD
MKIEPYPLHKYSTREQREVDFLILHYTAGNGNAKATARVFEVPGRSASAHYIVGRDAGVLQCVPLSMAAWHAGDGGHSRLPSPAQLAGAAIAENPEDRFIPLKDVPPAARVVNQRSVGIEMCNRGWAHHPNYPSLIVRHRNPASTSTRWEAYPDALIETVIELVEDIKKQVPTLKYVAGHEDVTHRDTLGKSGAKLDPGPAWPWPNLGLRRVYYDFRRHGWVVGDE